MPFCTNCGHPLTADVKFCPDCGQPVKKDQEAEQPKLYIKPEVISVSPRSFFSRFRFAFLSVVGLFVLSIAIYFLLKPNPAKAGRSIGNSICNCKEDSAKFSTQLLKNFRDSFDTKHFPTKQEAIEILTTLYSQTKNRFDSCYNAALKKIIQNEMRFASNEDLFQKFDSALYKRQAACSILVNPELVSIKSSLFQKIKLLIDPDPSENKIKNDLIGNKMLTWNFDYLDEFQKIEISKKTRSNDRIDYDLNLSLIDQNDNSSHDAIISVTYILNDKTWELKDIISKSITYTYNILPNNWQSLTLVPNTPYTITGNRFWVQDGSNGQIYKGGGTDGQRFALTSPTIYLMSRETDAVQLVVTYYPPGN